MKKMNLFNPCIFKNVFNALRTRIILCEQAKGNLYEDIRLCKVTHVSTSYLNKRSV